jgi:hypothetical protein
MPVGVADRQFFERLAITHDALRRRVERMGVGASPAAVLDIGVAVVFHGAVEECWPQAADTLLEPATVAQFAIEHARLAEDLDLLASLAESHPSSPDLGSLADALLARLREHITRDDRVFYQSIPRLRGAPVRRPCSTR